MPIDDGIMANIRRSGWAGSGPQATQDAQDRIDGENPADILRTRYERLSEQQLHNRANQSVQDHVDRQAGSTGGAGTDQD